MMPDESLIQAEWEKHGKCVALVTAHPPLGACCFPGTCAFRSGDEYLNTIEQLYTRLTIPELEPLLADKRVDQYKIKRAFLEKNPGLRANQITVYMKGKELVDIKICYDLKLNFTACYR